MQNFSQSPYPRSWSWQIQGEHGSLLRGARQALSSRHIGLWTLLPRTVWRKPDGDYIWMLIQESDLQYTRKSRKTTHFWTFLSDFWLSLSTYHASVVFLSHRINKNVKISLFCHNKYEIFLGCFQKIKVCAECSRFSIGFRHKQLKYNTWKPGTNIVLHSVIFQHKKKETKLSSYSQKSLTGSWIRLFMHIITWIF